MEDITLQAIANRMKAARTMANLEQQEAAKQLGISRVTLSSYETAKSDASVRNVRKMALLYGVSVDWLLCLTDKMHSE